MNVKKRSFLSPDQLEELQSRVTLVQVAAHYGANLPKLHRVSEEVRSRCFLNCGRTEETGDRVLALNLKHPAKQWRCHQYGCGKGGNLISMCDLLKPGTHHQGRPRGDRFKQIIADLQAMTEGISEGQSPTPVETASDSESDSTIQEPQKNVPLAESPNERARALTDLDEKFTVDVAQMKPSASSYFRKRPFLTPEVCREWRMGYLPRDAGGDTRGGTMRGKIVYALLDTEENVLTWFGRDPDYETKHAKWTAGGRQEKEPAKFHFVKGFHRGLELYGQHRINPDHREQLKEMGLVLVEGPNNVIRLATLGQTSVGLCSNTISQGQILRIKQLAQDFAGGKVSLLLDADVEGDRGAKDSLWLLAEEGLDVRLVWSRSMFGGRYADRQPESVTTEEWTEVRHGLAL